MMFLGIHDVQLLLIACIPQIPHSLGIIVSHSKDPSGTSTSECLMGFAATSSINASFLVCFPHVFVGWHQGSSRFKVFADSWCHFGWLGKTS